MTKKTFKLDSDFNALSDIQVEVNVTVREKILFHNYGVKFPSFVKGEKSDRTAYWIIHISNFLLEKDPELTTIKENDVVCVKGQLDFKFFTVIDKETNQQKIINTVELRAKEAEVISKFDDVMNKYKNQKTSEEVKEQYTIRDDPYEKSRKAKEENTTHDFDIDNFEKID